MSVQTPYSNHQKVVNTSGQGPDASVPAEIAGKFNWGAFLLSWVWGIGNKTYITFVVFLSAICAMIPVLGMILPLAVVIWFGMKGNEWAWQNKHWDSVEAFNQTQKNWAIAGVIVSVVGIVSMIMLFALFGAMMLGAGAAQAQ